MSFGSVCVWGEGGGGGNYCNFRDNTAAATAVGEESMPSATFGPGIRKCVYAPIMGLLAPLELKCNNNIII